MGKFEHEVAENMTPASLARMIAYMQLEAEESEKAAKKAAAKSSKIARRSGWRRN